MCEGCEGAPVEVNGEQLRELVMDKPAHASIERGRLMSSGSEISGVFFSAPVT